MTTRVIVDQNTSSGQMCAEAVDHVLKAKATFGRLNGILYSAIYTGNGPDLTAVAAELGIAEAQAQQAFDLINAATAALDDSRITALREIDQG
jgi:hypothetical protein